MNLALKYFVVVLLFFSNFSIGQNHNLFILGTLPEDLSEASGLEILNDTTLISINDGGNGAEIFLLNLNGSLQRKITVLNEKNNDWEDVTRDENFLYIADIGNNNNTRNRLVILKINLNDIKTKDEVRAEKIYFKYKEQTAFPPEKENKKFDAEAIVSIGDSLLILTKTNTIPWTGKSQLYYVSKLPGIYTISVSSELFIGSNGWYVDAITAADFLNEKLYILTYNRLIVFNFANKRPKRVFELKFDQLTQKEGIVAKNEKEWYIIDERHRVFGGGNLLKAKK